MDPKSGPFILVTSHWRRLFSVVQFFFFALQAGNANYTLLQSLLRPEYFILRHFVFHLTLASTSAVVLVWYAMYWIKWPRETAMLFNYSFPASTTTTVKIRPCRIESCAPPATAIALSSVEKVFPSTIQRRILDVPLKDIGAQKRTKLMWLLLSNPIVGAQMFIFVVIIFLHEPSIRALNFFGKPDTSWSGYVMTTLKPAYFMLYLLSSVSASVEMQLLYFQKVLDKLRTIVRL